MRGEYKNNYKGNNFPPGSSPLARGVQLLSDASNQNPRIIPACAGNTTIVYVLLLPGDHPRLRGEYQNQEKRLTCSLGSSPLARGIQLLKIRFLLSMRIIPACAGNTWVLRFNCRVDRDHPRLRGEYYKNFWNCSIVVGSSPLARGIHSQISKLRTCDRIIPACAGNTELLTIVKEKEKDHPRLRGEYTKKSLHLRDPCFLS